MTDFVEPNFEGKTQALKRDFENREFVTDFSVSVQQLASFVSNFESAATSKLAALDGKLARLERLLEALEKQQGSSVGKENQQSNTL
ncbi:TPA: protein complex oligomerization [Trebouxia sp. C0004]